MFMAVMAGMCVKLAYILADNQETESAQAGTRARL